MSVKIVEGKFGWHLKVNNLYISIAYDNPPKIKAIKWDSGIPYGSTEFLSIDAIKAFWKEYMKEIIDSTKKPYKSVWGNLELINEKE